MAEWKFRRMEKSEIGRNPVESEFFTTDDVGNISAALVRESIQNSLDARSDKSKAIQFRFFFSGSDYKQSQDQFKNYMNSLQENLTAKENGLKNNEIPNFNEGMPYLLIEDANTFGLEGDVLKSDDPNQNDKNNFYWFWRNIGRSNKSEQDRGRWGLGKTVFPSASKINTYFGFTLRENDKVRNMMGQCILKIHKINGEEKRISPYGYFGEFDDDEDEFFATPVTNEIFLNKIEKDYNLIRADNPGLSIIITYPWEEINSKTILKEVISQYYYAILSRDLVVDIEDPSKNIFYTINYSKIYEILEDVEFNLESESDDQVKYRMTKLFNLCEKIKNTSSTNVISFSPPPSLEYQPVWRKEWYVDEIVAEKIESKRQLFENGEVVIFEIPVKVHEAGGKPEFSSFKVAVQLDEDLESSDIHFIRDGIEITGIKTMNKRGLRAIIIIDDNKLSQLLGDSENPAHTEWQRNSKNFKGKYVHGENVISFVIASVNYIYQWLKTPSEGIEEDLLNNFFWVEIDEEERSDITEGAGDESGSTTTKPVIDIESRKKKLNISQINDGVTITNNNLMESSEVRVRFAYKVSRGNPLKRYSQLDFELGKNPISVEINGLTILKQEKNMLVFKVFDDDFRLNVNGFDTNRDLLVDIKYL